MMADITCDFFITLEIEGQIEHFPLWNIVFRPGQWALLYNAHFGKCIIWDFHADRTFACCILQQQWK